MLERELEIAISLAREAGAVISDLYGTDLVAESKIGVDEHAEPVTIADREASSLIVARLAESFPDDGILSEEEPDDTGARLERRRVWIIDPLDGTAGFVRRDGDFAVQIGLVDDGQPILGAIYLPFHDRLTYAVKGQGAFLARNGDGPIRLSTSAITSPAEMTLALSRNHPSPRMGRIIEHLGFERTVRRGSVGLKVGLIAGRECDIYIHPSPRTKLWDTCAPQIILEEAGGTFTDLFGSRIVYDRADVQNRNGILASNGPSHARVVALLGPLLEEFGRVPHP